MITEARAPRSASRLIGKDTFAELYAAAAFAEAFAMPLDTTVTLAWSLMGYDTDEAVQAAFLSFTKCLRDWLEQRSIPVAFLFAHEHGGMLGLHTHVIVYVPGYPLPFRQDFRRWARNWCRRQVGQRVPYALRVRGPALETPWLHWLLMSYLTKGYDPEVVVQSAARSPDGRLVHLGDLIAVPWQDPGPVTLRRRAGASRSLGPERRRIGVPAGLDYLLAPPLWPVLQPFKVTNAVVPWMRVQPRPTPTPPFAPPNVRGPFRSAYEDGARDIWDLYPQGFCERITGLTVKKSDPATPSPMTQTKCAAEQTALLATLGI